MLLNYIKLYFLLLILFSTQISAVDISKDKKISILEHSNIHISTPELKVEELIKNSYLQPYTKNYLNIVDPNKHTVWVDFELSNNSNKNIEKILVLSSPLLENIKLYDNKKLNNPRIIGATLPDPKHLTLLYNYTIKIDAYSTNRYYMRVYSHYVPVKFSLYVEEESAFKTADKYKQLENILLIGIVLALVLYSFMLYFYTSDKSYLFYSMYLFMLIYHQFTYLGLTQIYFPNFAKIDIELAVFKLGGLMLTSAIFSIYFLNIKKFNRVYLVYKVFITIILAKIIIMSNPELYNIQIILFTGVSFIVLNLISGIISYIKGEKQARLYILGFGIIFIAYFLLILNELAIISIEKIPNILVYATVIEALVLLLAFADRYKILERQKDRVDRDREQIIRNEVLEKTAQLNLALNTKELLLKEIHHRVKNNLQIILSMIRLQNDNIKDKSISNKFLNLENRINAIAKTYNMLIFDDNIDEIDMEEYIESLLMDIEDSMYRDNVEIETHIDATLPLGKSVYIGIIINELVTNSYKYAFDSSGGKIDISLEKIDIEYILIIKDNGRGFDYKQDSESLGLKLIHALVEEQLKGDIEMRTEGLTQYQIRFSI